MRGTTGQKAVGSLLLCLLPFMIVVFVTGCGSPPGRFQFSTQENRRDPLPAPDFNASLPQVEQGRRIAFMDYLGHCLFSLPGKVILCNTRIGNHKISEDNVQGIRYYLWRNELDRVKVRVNQYAPMGEFKRLWRNRDVNPFYRATFGFFTWMGYTLLPGRVFAGFPFVGDNYNPYTNTISVYSNDPALMVQQASRARYWAERRYKGTHAVLGLVPGVDLYQEHVATRDTIRWFYYSREKSKEIACYRVLYPAYPTRFGQVVVAIGPIPAAIHAAVALPGAVAGHIVGYERARRRLKTDDPPPKDAVAGILTP